MQAGLSLALITLLFPPWQFLEPGVYGGVHSDEIMRGLHFSFIMGVPYYSAYINAAVLGVEIGFILMLSLLVMVSVTKPKRSAA